MGEGVTWFSAKRRGYGSGLPIAWQGWLVTAIYVGIVFAAAFRFGDRWLTMLSIIVPATLLFMLVCARSTKSGWRWRSGDKD